MIILSNDNLWFSNFVFNPVSHRDMHLGFTLSAERSTAWCRLWGASMPSPISTYDRLCSATLGSLWVKAISQQPGPGQANVVNVLWFRSTLVAPGFLRTKPPWLAWTCSSTIQNIMNKLRINENKSAYWSTDSKPDWFASRPKCCCITRSLQPANKNCCPRLQLL